MTTREELLATIHDARVRLDNQIQVLHVLVICARVTSDDSPLQLADLAAAAGLTVSAIEAARVDDTGEDIIAWICRSLRPDDPAHPAA